METCYVGLRVGLFDSSDRINNFTPAFDKFISRESASWRLYEIYILYIWLQLEWRFNCEEHVSGIVLACTNIFYIFCRSAREI